METNFLKIAFIIFFFNMAWSQLNACTTNLAYQIDSSRLRNKITFPIRSSLVKVSLSITLKKILLAVTSPSTWMEGKDGVMINNREIFYIKDKDTKFLVRSAYFCFHIRIWIWICIWEILHRRRRCSSPSWTLGWVFHSGLSSSAPHHRPYNYGNVNMEREKCSYKYIYKYKHKFYSS